MKSASGFGILRETRQGIIVARNRIPGVDQDADMFEKLFQSGRRGLPAVFFESCTKTLCKFRCLFKSSARCQMGQVEE